MSHFWSYRFIRFKDEFLCIFDRFRVVKCMIVVGKSKGDKCLVSIHEKYLNMLYFDVQKSDFGLEVDWLSNG